MEQFQFPLRRHFRVPNRGPREEGIGHRNEDGCGGVGGGQKGIGIGIGTNGDANPKTGLPSASLGLFGLAEDLGGEPFVNSPEIHSSCGSEGVRARLCKRT
eukprot:4041358-Pyramimonas_sp.AAC.1